MTLTPSQLDVLRLVAHGDTYTEIASKLHMSERTVKNRMSEAIKTLNARSKTHAVVLAIGSGLLRLNGQQREVPIAIALQRIAQTLGYKVINGDVRPATTVPGMPVAQGHRTGSVPGGTLRSAQEHFTQPGWGTTGYR